MLLITRYTTKLTLEFRTKVIDDDHRITIEIYLQLLSMNYMGGLGLQLAYNN